MTRLEREKHTVEKMVRLYCRGLEKNSELCEDCRSTLEYALKRLDHCPHGNNKPTCRQCTTHCYNVNVRRHMQAIMRYSGPRMILHHPLAAIRHLFRELKIKN